jgi:aminoglycoside/choline kinase family phosphotransferase
LKSPKATSPFPHSPEEITVVWLNGVLRDAGVLTDDALEAVEVQPTTAGFGIVGSHARLHLSYTKPLPDAPQSLFAKFSSDNPSVRARYHKFGHYEREVCFYRDVAPQITLRIPRCYFAAMNADSGESLVLLEDLTAGRAGDNLVGCSTQEAERLFRQIAAFHAQWWGNPFLSHWKWLAGFDRYKTMITEVIRRAWPLFRQKYIDLFPAWVIDTAARAIQRSPEIFRALAAGPATLIHGDFKLDNVLFDLPDAPLAIFDWQVPVRTLAAWDISWFLVRSLPVPQRRADEEHLVRVYHTALVEAGVRVYSLKTLHRHIKLGFLFALLIAIFQSGSADTSERRRQDFTAWIERNIAMLEDHEVWEALA